MTNEERRALAKRWEDIPLNHEWALVARSFRELRDEGHFLEDESALSFVIRVTQYDTYFDKFDLLVQRVLENKLLGDTK